MKKVGLLLVLVLVLAACVPAENAADIARAQNGIEAARNSQNAAQAVQITTRGMSVGGSLQIFILVLFVLFLSVRVILAVCIYARFLTIWRCRTPRPGFDDWNGGPNANWNKVDEQDLYQQSQLDQLWLFSELLFPNQNEADQPDQGDLPNDWWG